MNEFLPLLLSLGMCVGCLLTLLLVWQAANALLRLVFAARTPLSVSIFLLRLAKATKQRQSWEVALRGLRLELPWPWPWRLTQAADHLHAGVAAGEVLVTSRLLPARLRGQAGQALNQGPDAFIHWCMTIARQSPEAHFPIRQGSFLLAELVVVVGMMHFLIIYIYPGFEKIMRELNISPPAWSKFLHLPITWEIPGILLLMSLAIGSWLVTLTWRWQRRRHHAAAYLLLASSSARLPETALCKAAGWNAATPLELARAVRQAEFKENQREAGCRRWSPPWPPSSPPSPSGPWSSASCICC